MKEKGQRAFALIGALLFLATSVGFSAYVIWQMNHDKEQASPQQTALDQTTNQQEATLEGTKLTNFTPLNNVDKIQITDIQEGTGPVVAAGAIITAHYTGALVKDGTIFESSKDAGKPFTARLVVPSESPDGRGLIAGWVQGIPGMKVGGIRRLVIPAALAYGERGSPPKIGPNEPLVFDIEVLDLQ